MFGKMFAKAAAPAPQAAEPGGIPVGEGPAPSGDLKLRYTRPMMIKAVSKNTGVSEEVVKQVMEEMEAEQAAAKAAGTPGGRRTRRRRRGSRRA